MDEKPHPGGSLGSRILWALSSIALIYVQFGLGFSVAILMIGVRWPGLDLALGALRAAVAVLYAVGFVLTWIEYWRHRPRFVVIAAVWVLGILALLAGAAWAGAHFVWPGLSA